MSKSITIHRARPIEPGCLAIITYSPAHPEWTWRIVEVFARCTVHPNSWDISIWDDDGNIVACYENDLLRIDDPDESESLETVKTIEVVE